MARSRTTHRSFRLAAGLAENLLRRARDRGESVNALAERYLEEGLRMEDHPLISFRDGAAGRRAAIAGTRLDVHQVIDTLRANDNSVERTAEYHDIPETWVRAAARYYAAYRDEVDEFAARVEATAEHEYALWQGEQAVLA